MFHSNGLWQATEQAARDALTNPGIPFNAARCRFQYSDNMLSVTLPSWRSVYYQNARLDYGSYGEPGITYDKAERTCERTYGAKLVENIVQAICRDLLAESLIRCVEHQLPVVHHVHDEIVVETTAGVAQDALTALLRLMTQPANWALDLPLEARGFLADWLAKKPESGTEILTFVDGDVRQ